MTLCGPSFAPISSNLQLITDTKLSFSKYACISTLAPAKGYYGLIMLFISSLLTPQGLTFILLKTGIVHTTKIGTFKSDLFRPFILPPLKKTLITCAMANNSILLSIVSAVSQLRDLYQCSDFF